MVCNATAVSHMKIVFSSVRSYIEVTKTGYVSLLSRPV